MNRILFKKEGRAKFISHLDLMRTMQRVFIRAGLMIKHTSGFNPHPYMAFALPLSVGTESVCELMDFELIDGAPLDEVPERLNGVMPEGITVLSAYESEHKFKDIKWLDIICHLVYDKGIDEDSVNGLKELFSSESLMIERSTKRGTAVVDIIPLIDSLNIDRVSTDTVLIRALISAQEPSLSPAHLLSAIEQKAPELFPDYTTFKRLEIFDKDHKVFR